MALTLPCGPLVSQSSRCLPLHPLLCSQFAHPNWVRPIRRQYTIRSLINSSLLVRSKTICQIIGQVTGKFRAPLEAAPTRSGFTGKENAKHHFARFTVTHANAFPCCSQYALLLGTHVRAPLSWSLIAHVRRGQKLHVPGKHDHHSHRLA